MKLLTSLAVYCEVAPLSRPRFNKKTGSVYQPKENQRSLIHEIREVWMENRVINQPVRVTVEAFVARKNSKLAYPRMDVDNVLKGVLDALVICGVLYDDDLVVAVNAKKAFADESHVLIDIWSI